MVFLTEQTNQKFQISHEGIIWKDKRSIKTEEQSSFFLSYEWSLLDCRSKDGRKYVWSPSWAGQHIDCLWRWVTNHSTTFLTTAIICWTLKLKIAGLRQSRDICLLLLEGVKQKPPSPGFEHLRCNFLDSLCKKRVQVCCGKSRQNKA